jgi:hypothetical protein
MKAHKIGRARIPHCHHMNLHCKNSAECTQLVYDLIHNSKHKEVWLRSTANEFGQLAQGVGGRVKGMDTIKFIHKCKVPTEQWKDIKYGSFTCDLRPNKEEKEQSRLTAGSDCINYQRMLAPPQRT